MRETWEACIVVSTSMVVVVETESGSFGKSSAWRAFFDVEGGLVYLYLQVHTVKWIGVFSDLAVVLLE